MKSKRYNLSAAHLHKSSLPGNMAPLLTIWKALTYRLANSTDFHPYIIATAAGDGVKLYNLVRDSCKHIENRCKTTESKRTARGWAANALLCWCRTLFGRTEFSVQHVPGKGLGIVAKEKFTMTPLQLAHAGLVGIIADYKDKGDSAQHLRSSKHSSLVHSTGHESVLFGPASLLNEASHTQPRSKLRLSNIAARPPAGIGAVHAAAAAFDQGKRPYPLQRVAACAGKSVTFTAGAELTVGYGTAYNRHWRGDTTNEEQQQQQQQQPT